MKTRFIPPFSGLLLLLGLLGALTDAHAQGQDFLTGFQLNVLDPAGGATSADVYRWTPETRAVRIGRVSNGGARFTFEQTGWDLAEGTRVQVVQVHGVEGPALYLVPEEHVRSLENLEMLGPQDALDRLATFDWGRVPIIDVQLEHAPAIPGMGFSDAGRDLFAEPQATPSAPRRGPYFGITGARDRERSGTSFGVFGEYSPATIGDRVQVLTTAQVERAGLNYGRRVVGTVMVVGRLPVADRAGIRLGAGFFLDNTSVDFGSGSVSDSGNGTVVSAAIDFDVTPRWNLAGSVDRQSAEGFTPRLYRFSVGFRF